MTEDDPLVDTIVADRYRIIRKIGEGGMSVVFEAQHIKLARAFALKGLLPHLCDNEEVVQRFEREAELLGSLRHPNIVDISDWCTLPDGSPCMVLEFLHGAALIVRMHRAQLPWDGILRVAEQSMSALALAHRLGITHRDLKPENIFISIDDVGEERVKLLDFGISKLRGVNRLSGVHKMLGTPSYMSPEQAQGLTDQIGPTTDCWAMGAILYEMATQRVAFRGETLMDTLTQIISKPPDPMNLYRRDVPPAFQELIDCTLTTDDSKRIQSIEEMRDRLRLALDPRTISRVSTPVIGVPRPAPMELRPLAAPPLLTPGPKPQPPKTPLPGELTAVRPQTPVSLEASPASGGRRWMVIMLVVLILVGLGNVAIALLL